MSAGMTRSGQPVVSVNWQVLLLRKQVHPLHSVLKLVKHNSYKLQNSYKINGSPYPIFLGVINIMSLTVSLSSLCVLALLRCYVIYLEFDAFGFQIWKIVIIGCVGKQYFCVLCM